MRKADPELQSRRRAEIIAAAELCFLKRGFHQSSMQNIAEAAGVSMGLLYRYFANKVAIIEGAAEQDQAATLAAISALPDDGDVVQSWTILITDMAEQASASEYVALANEIVSEASRSPKLKTMLQNNDELLAIAICNKLDCQRKNGVLKKQEDAKNAAQAIMLLFDGLTTRQFVNPKQSIDAITPLISKILRVILE